MKKFVLLMLCLSTFQAMGAEVKYYGKTCERTPRSNMLTRTTNRIYINGLMVSEDKVPVERPIRDAWVHLNNPLRHRNTKYHFEDNYLAGSGKFNGNYVQFFSEPGVVFDPVVKGNAAHGIIAIGLENQDSSRSVYLEIPHQGKEIILQPETSCLYFFKASNTEKTTFRVRSDVFHGYLYQKLYYNNNVDGNFLRKQYQSYEFEPYKDTYIPEELFHKYYPHYPDMNTWIEVD